ncbi:MAG: hypothetical protein H6600_05000 [Flavobacteriales bacterium]|nr:hypothetical protein [Flavobacteriales bacterium]MCB9197795.1 hypothetical protein [Flavobacteriales bacterium]
MKKLDLILFLLLFCHAISFGQLATVTGGNFGASASVGMIMNKPTGSGWGTNIGLTTSFYEVFFPEISFGYSSSNYGIDSTGDDLINQSKFLGLGLNNKIPFLSIKMGKSKHQECWYLNFKLLFDYRYDFRFGNRSSFEFISKNENGINLGLGIRPSFSGSDKSRIAWAFFYDIYYHMDLNKTDQPILASTSQHNGLFFRLTFLHYKTSDMLGGGSKRKAYNRKY